MTDIETDNGYVLGSSHDGPLHAPIPPYVQTPEGRDRWTVCAGIVTRLSELLEPSGRADPRFVWVGTRALYNSDIPTGKPA